MSNWYSDVVYDIVSTVSGDPFWEPYLRNLQDRKSNVNLHLAVMVEPFLTYMLDGRKTIESRFSVKRTAPFHRIHGGDVILLKRASGPIVALCIAKDIWFYRLDPNSWRTIKEDFATYICAQDPSFWREREHTSFATLIRVDRVTPVEHISINKRDRRGWVVLTPSDQLDRLPLFQTQERSMTEEAPLTEPSINARQGLLTSCATNRDLDCARGVHSYNRARRVNAEGYLVCALCGADSIDWTQLHRKKIEESETTFAQLTTDRFRLEWWTKDIDRTARNHALRKGLLDLEQAAIKRLAKSVGLAHPIFDGRQTPKSGNVIFYAQHALACCCRKCIQNWHGIPRGVPLDPDALFYFTQLIMKFIRLRIPGLSSKGARVIGLKT
jgi:hypothetical protein